ncbi:Conserved oligomeric Golgi complex subunit 2 [Purpureocillium lavendulum]|uniref:Conserved oligomeric Golgi complex subunit 2 n=1 Tax=Purpureocillium lavendulum TaxID=1247861 RepID=A0AB34FH18_9HYPO|nr:Conserved oligomeric Golgi complex subunit 2 [Purpureocillium lavendulum]
MGGFDSVGTLLADIANLLSDGLRILSLADKRHWGADEHEQLRALELALDEAKKDFQELAPLVNGQFYYEHDRKHESVEELRALRSRFDAHVYNLKDWSRSGGPINPIWVRDTHALQSDLHRAQRRAARRIFTSDQVSSQRCLGAFLVHRVQRRAAAATAAGGQRGRPAPGGKASAATATVTARDSADTQRMQLEELAACTRVGGFERFGEDDIAFICDFCDGHLVWEDLESVPTSRAGNEAAGSPAPLLSTPAATSTSNPNWQAIGTTMSGGREKPVVYAPLVVANHVAPAHGDWQARVLCPYCEEEARRPQHEDDDDDAYKPEYEFDDVAALQEHLEWQHPVAAAANGAVLSTAARPGASIPSTNSCQIM